MNVPEKYINALDEIGERYVSGVAAGVDDIAWDAKKKLSSLERDFKRREIDWLPREQVDMLREMTDGTLTQAGYDLSDGQPAPVVVFTANMGPKSRYDLKIYSVADGIAGFNTTSFPGRGQNFSRRWVIYTDRGESLGHAYDYKEAVYTATGVQEKSGLMENIPTPLETIIPFVFSNHIGPIQYKLEP